MSQVAGVVPESDRLPETDDRPRERARWVLKLYRPVYMRHTRDFDLKPTKVKGTYIGYVFHGGFKAMPLFNLGFNLNTSH